MPNKTIYRQDYQPYPFSITSIDLKIDLYEDHALVHNQMVCKRQHTGALILNGENLELLHLHLNKEELNASQYQQDESALTISCPDECTLHIVTKIYPHKNTALSGLYRSHQLFCTQCEAEGFRRITYFPDRPDVLTTFTTTISAEKTKYPDLLSNGNLVEQGKSDDERHWVKWHDPFKKPSYLFALVAGKLDCIQDTFVTESKRAIDLRVYVEPGNKNRAAHAMTSLKKAMRWDEEKFGREYDLDTFMIVAVSDFNMGAMENKGLNIFNSKYILACPKSATDEDFANIEGVIGHEYFHNWTGNRVTCRDWFQLSLKEGLTVFRDQEFSADMNSRDVNRIQNVKILLNSQFPEDAGSMAHPVRPESYQEINNFYTATIYNKGAEVIRMQHTLLGSEGFRRGMDLYFQRHDGQAVTIDDFVAAMEDANQLNLTQFKLWYSQAGTPEVTVENHFENQQLTLTFSQSCPPTPLCQEKKPFHIPIQLALFEKSGKIIKEQLVELKEEQIQVRFDNLAAKPIISLLRDFSAPIKLHQQLSQNDWIALLQCETNGYAKWNAAQSIVINTLTGWLKSEPTSWRIAPPLIDAFTQILNDKNLDLALRAYLLMPPDFETLTASFNTVDVEQVEKVRDAYRHQLGTALFNDAKTIYQHLSSTADNTMHGVAYGQRKLKNICLYLMMKADEQQALSPCLNQFSTAETMTEKMASFSLLANVNDNQIRQSAIDSFYTEWSTNDLVIEKWFSVQATAEVKDTLTNVKKLLSHPAFVLTNPNKVRSLIGAFVQANPRHFHAIDGSGYQFLTDMLLKLDVINPQITARLATPFTRSQRLDSARQALIKKQLAHLSAQKISRDLREVVDKSLNQ